MGLSLWANGVTRRFCPARHRPGVRRALDSGGMVTRMLLPAPSGPLDGWEASPPGDDGDYYCSAVLVPGSEPIEEFVPLMEALAAGGHRVLTLEHRGDLDVTVQDVSVAVTAAAARHPVHLAGRALGAAIAVRVAELAPDKCVSLAVIGDYHDAAFARVAALGVPLCRVPDEPEAAAEELAAFWRVSSGVGAV
jgi:hypothetical protein